MNGIGIDIGTTSICAIVLEVKTGEVLETLTAENDCKLKGQSFERLQDAEKIVEKVNLFVETLAKKYAPVACIGVTGQMHGIVYVDEKGLAVSPLYSWQDESANESAVGGKTYAQKMTEITGYKMSSGFGLSTLYMQTKKGRIPNKAKKICAIHDYVAMRLTGRSTPLVHPSSGASFGCFDVKNRRFDTVALKKTGIDLSFLPEIGSDRTVVGSWKGIPVAIAVGDNQASYVGSVANMQDCVLVNVGTGSQVSFPIFGETVLPTEAESRPCTDERTIGVGSSLCGGRSFAALEKFFRTVCEMVTGEEIPSAYLGMNKALEGLTDMQSEWKVSTKFCGTRANPNERGKIDGISLENFTPQSFMLGVLQGIVDELFETYEKSGVRAHTLIGSGNGIRKNKVLQKLFEKKFQMQLKIPRHKEEAAFGAVLYALVACGIYPSLDEAQRSITYECGS